MKKFLLLLSCCLATWCSVQAGMKSSASCSEASGMTQGTVMQASAPLAASAYDDGCHITSATFDASKSVINIKYTSRNASTIRFQLLSIRKGGNIGEPVIINSYNINGSATMPVNPTWEEGQYVVLMYVNGSPRSNFDVFVTPQGKLGNISYSDSNNNVTVSYTMKNAFNSDATLRVIDSNGNEVLKYIKDPNTSKSISFGYKLTPKVTYTFKLYSKSTLLDTKTYVYIPTPINPSGTIQTVTYEPYGTSITVDYILKNAENPTVSIYDYWSGSLIKGGVAIANSSSSKRITIDGLALESWYRYIVKISANGGKWSTEKEFKTETVLPNPRPSVDAITNLNYNISTNKLAVDYSLKNSGSTVEIILMSTKSGRNYSSGSWREMNDHGTANVSIPSENGSVLYVVLLKVNGSIQASKQINISR